MRTTEQALPFVVVVLGGIMSAVVLASAQGGDSGSRSARVGSSSDSGTVYPMDASLIQPMDASMLGPMDASLLAPSGDPSNRRSPENRTGTTPPRR